MNYKKSKKIKQMLVFLAISVFIIAGILFFYVQPKSESQIGEQKKVFVTQENIPAYLESSSIIKSLPRNSLISLSVGDLKYSILEGSISQGLIDDPEIIIEIPESYLNKEWGNLCSLIKKASSKKDVLIEIKISKAKLMWKYKGLLKYRDCVK